MRQWASADSGVYVHASGRYRLHIYLPQYQNIHRAGDWTLTDMLEDKCLGKYHFYGRPKLKPPTTWANRLIMVIRKSRDVPGGNRA